MADSIPTSAAQSSLTIAANAVGDQPTTEDSLGFGPYVEAITAFLTSDSTQPPLTMSIEGEWGSGKSSFMLQLEKAIRGPSRTDVFMHMLPQSMGGINAEGSLKEACRVALRQKQRTTIQFNAWRHDKQDALWAAFALKFAKSLRKQVGHVRGWKGDISLFLRRLKGLKGWVELVLLFCSLLFLIVGIAGLYRFVSIHPPDEIKRIFTRPTAVQSNNPSQPSNPVKPLPEPYEFLISRGKWGALLALAILGFTKFHKQLKIPLSINLEKYLSKPDYQGHVAFIESFHEDFARLVKAYAKNRRIFVFIDDLDRCDVPRAAELMQAINLMIGDAGKLVFILGMDREKVAAGITQKYKDLLPFIQGLESPDSGPSSQSSALYFGYSYLEKFIQLSFTLPVMSDPELLMRFLSSMNSHSDRVGWLTRLVNFWSSQVKPWRQRKNLSPIERPVEPHGRLEVPVTNPGTKAVAQDKRVRSLRVKVEKDSDQILKIVAMVSVIFENNPRKLKQFINTFRLSLFLASSQAIFDEEENVRPVTVEQLGKFVAITLRFPDLRSALSADLKLLADLEEAAQTTRGDISSYLRKWLGHRGVKEVLSYGLELGGNPFGHSIFSLKSFPVLKLLSILPNVPEKPPQFGSTIQSTAGKQSPHAVSEPTGDEELARPFELLGQRYEEIRAQEGASPERTVKMTQIFGEARDKASGLSPKIAKNVVALFMAKSNAGSRLMAIAIAMVRGDPTFVPWLLSMLENYRSPFEHYQCIMALLGYSRFLSKGDCESILEALGKRWEDIKADPGRVVQAESLRQAAQRQIGEVSSPTASLPDAKEIQSSQHEVTITSVASDKELKQTSEGQEISEKTADAAGQVESRLFRLDPETRPTYEEALQLLLREGSANEHYTLRFLNEKKLASNWVSVFSGLQRNTNLVQPVPGQPDRIRPEEKEWQIKPELKSSVAAYFRRKA